MGRRRPDAAFLRPARGGGRTARRKTRTWRGEGAFHRLRLVEAPLHPPLFAQSLLGSRHEARLLDARGGQVREALR